MAPRSVSRVHVISITTGLGDEIQSLLTKSGHNVEVKEILLEKYGDLKWDKKVLRKLTSAALEDVKAEEIEYLLAHCPIIVEVLSRPNNRIKWAQCPSAGVDAFFSDFKSLEIGHEFIMTRTSGTEVGQMMAEYVLAHILARERHLNLLTEHQKQATYNTQGWLGGAVLDVFNQEPLPSDSPLWTLPGVTITPHVSCLAKNHDLMVAQAYVDNLIRHLDGQELVNQVDFTKGY